MDKFRPKLCIMDDDPVFTSMLKAQLENHFSDIIIDQTNDPIVVPDYNVYCIDNDFRGKKISCDLLRHIRSYNPNALVVACSSTLDDYTLRHLMNGGCNAVYDKNSPDESQEAFSVIENYLRILEQHVTINRGKPVRTIIQSLQNLLSEWNRRLAKEL